MATLRIEKLFDALAMTDGQISTAISQFTGQTVLSDLIDRAKSGAPITAIHADAICKWLSQQYGKEIKPENTDLKVHPASVLPDDTFKTEEGQKAALAYLESKGYRITPPALQPEPMYQEGDYLKGDLHPRNWKALANPAVPWPANLDPKQVLHEMAPFLTFRLLSEQAVQHGRDINALISPDEDL